MLDLTAPPATPNGWATPESWWPTLSQATAHLPAPVATISREALQHNAVDMLVRAGGMPIRVASKSIRVRSVLDAVLRLPGYEGILAFTLAEAVWLAKDHSDIVLGYPTVDTAALRELLTTDGLSERITLMIDDESQLDIVDAVLPVAKRPVVRVAIDADASWRGGPLGHIGVRRSPLFTAAEVAAFAARVASRPGFRLVGAMMYEAQIAGQGDKTGSGDGVIRWMQKQSGAELRERRGAIVRALRSLADIEFINGGGTGSLEYTSGDTAVTEVTAGSGFLAGTLFDGYRGFTLAPAAAFAFDVVRKPLPDIATVLGGGWIASGPPVASRQPTPVWPQHLKMQPREGAGEVQTPLQGATATSLRVGDRVWFRHAKSGEGSERVLQYHLIDEGVVVGEAPTYRGEGKAFL